MDQDLDRRRFTVDDYYRMGELGLLGPDERLELIEGDIVCMTPIGSPHAGRVNALNMLFAGRLAGRAVVAVQNPVRLAKDSEVQPDIALLRPRGDAYAGAHPEPGDVVLLLEVAETSLARDRRAKVPLYARTGVSEVWRLDLPQRRLEVYRRPAPEGYSVALTLAPGEAVAPEAFPDLALPVRDLLG